MTSPLIFCIEHPGIRNNGILFEAWFNGWPVPSHPHFVELAGDPKMTNTMWTSDIGQHVVAANSNYTGRCDELAQSFRSWIREQRLPVAGLLRQNKTGDNIHLNYITQTYDEIPSGAKYVYPILLQNANMLEYNVFLKNGLSIQKEVLDDCRSGRCKILIHQPDEGQAYNLKVNRFITAQSEHLQVPLSCFGFLDGNPETPALQAHYGTAGFYMFDWETHCGFLTDVEMEKQRTDILNKQAKPYHFINLNRKPRAHRLHVVTNIMTRWPDKILFSSDSYQLDPHMFESGWGGNIVHTELVRSGKLTKKIADALPIILDISMNVNDTQIRSSMLSLAYINLTSETMFFEADTTFLSEKKFKPIIFMQPFIVVGPHHSLQRLKDMGYQTFSPLINESYDNEKDPMKRLDLIYEEIERLTQLSHQQMQDLVFDTKEILFHNFENIKNRRNQLVKEKQLFIDLQEWVNG